MSESINIVNTIRNLNAIYNDSQYVDNKQEFQDFVDNDLFNDLIDAGFSEDNAHFICDKALSYKDNFASNFMNKMLSLIIDKALVQK